MAYHQCQQPSSPCSWEQDGLVSNDSAVTAKKFILTSHPSPTVPPSVVPWTVEQAVIKQIFLLCLGTEKVEWGTELCTSISFLGKQWGKSPMNETEKSLQLFFFSSPSHNGNRCWSHPHWTPLCWLWVNNAQLLGNRDDLDFGIIWVWRNLSMGQVAKAWALES